MSEFDIIGLREVFNLYDTMKTDSVDSYQMKAIYRQSVAGSNGSGMKAMDELFEKHENQNRMSFEEFLRMIVNLGGCDVVRKNDCFHLAIAKAYTKTGVGLGQNPGIKQIARHCDEQKKRPRGNFTVNQRPGLHLERQLHRKWEVLPATEKGEVLSSISTSSSRRHSLAPFER